jgi:hypothetical protein
VFDISDRQRALYLLQVRKRGRYAYWHFVRYNSRRYIVMTFAFACAICYMAWSSNWFGLHLIAGMALGLYGTDASWLRGQNKRWPFTLQTTNWAEVERQAIGSESDRGAA